MKVLVGCLAIGGWYPRGAARLIDSFHRESNGIEVVAWVNTLPPGAPAGVIENGWDYTAYCAKPWALLALRDRGADIGILVDAAFFACRHIQPLIDHVADVGYYLCRNGFRVGEWSSDRALEHFKITRDRAFEIEEASSYCVGIDFRRSEALALAEAWAAAAVRPGVFAGHHTSEWAEGRNRGPVSTDRRVKGHRHDQTALSILADSLLPAPRLIERPRFTAYAAGYGGAPNDQTVLINQGGL